MPRIKSIYAAVPAWGKYRYLYYKYRYYRYCTLKRPYCNTEYTVQPVDQTQIVLTVQYLEYFVDSRFHYYLSTLPEYKNVLRVLPYSSSSTSISTPEYTFGLDSSTEYVTHSEYLW